MVFFCCTKMGNINLMKHLFTLYRKNQMNKSFFYFLYILILPSSWQLKSGKLINVYQWETEHILFFFFFLAKKLFLLYKIFFRLKNKRKQKKTKHYGTINNVSVASSVLSQLNGRNIWRNFFLSLAIFLYLVDMETVNLIEMLALHELK